MKKKIKRYMKLEEIDNGFVISARLYSFVGDEKDRKYYCKNLEEVFEKIKDLLTLTDK